MPASTGSVTIHTVAATRVDQANSGTRARDRPGARRAITVVAMQIQATTSGHEHAARRPRRTGARRRRRSPPGPPSMAKAPTIEPAADEVGPRGGRRGPGEGDGGRADLQRHDRRGEADRERQQDQEGAGDRAVGERPGRASRLPITSTLDRSIFSAATSTAAAPARTQRGRARRRSRAARRPCGRRCRGWRPDPTRPGRGPWARMAP